MKFHELLLFLNEKKRDGSNKYSGLDFGYWYLEKFIQIPFQVPRPAGCDIARMLSTLNQQKPTTDAGKASEVSPALLFETQVDSPLVQDIVMTVAPALEHNPRLTSRFIDHFRLSAIIAEAKPGSLALPKTRSSQCSRLDTCKSF